MRQLQFRNNEITYLLDDNWKYDLSPFERKLSLSSRYSKNGSNAYGDRTTDARNMQFTRTLPTENDTSNIEFLLEIERFFDVSKAPFFFEDVGNGRTASIEVSRFESTSRDDTLRKRVEEIKLAVVMLDGEYEDLDPTINSDTLVNDATIEVLNPGRTIYPIVTITANALIQSFELRNITNSTGLSMSIIGFDVGQTIIINSRDGSITQDGVDVSFSIIDGGGIILSPGTNIIKYNSADGSIDIDVEWRAVYAN